MSTSSYFQGFLNPNSSDDFIAIRNWMISKGGLELNLSDAAVYALIYSLSIDEQAVFYGSLKYLISRTGLTKMSLIRILKRLQERQLILEVGHYVRGNNRTTKCYQANIEKADEAKESFNEYWTNAQKQTSDQQIVENSVSGNKKLPEDNVENSASGNKKLPEESFRSQNVTGSGNKMLPNKKYIKKDSLTSNSNPSNQPSILDDRAATPVDCSSRSDFTTNSIDGWTDDQRISKSIDEDPNIEIDPMDRRSVERSEKSEIDLDPSRISAALDILCDSSINRNRIHDVREAYSALLENGYTPVEIQDAWNHVQQQCLREAREPRYYPQLRKWLSSSAVDGARATIDAHRQRISDSNSKRNRSLFLKLRATNDEFRSIYTRYSEAKYQLEVLGRGDTAGVQRLHEEVQTKFKELSAK